MKIVFSRKGFDSAYGKADSPIFEKDRKMISLPLPVKDGKSTLTRHLKKRNVKFRIEPMATPVCRMAMIFDPDGNTICIHKRNAGR